jgi:1-acyl-sn-glycerol-3-phosphate acyltransferase
MDPLMNATMEVSMSGAEVFGDLDGPALIISNHSSHVDTPMLLCALPREMRERTAVTAAADYFFESTWRGLSTALAFGTVPIERRGGVPSSTPVDLLSDGWNLVIYPEGTRSPDGAMGRFRHGAAMLATNTGVPVVPAGLRGTFGAMPRGRSWPVPGKPAVSVRFGRPVRPAAGEDVRSFTARLSDEVKRLVAEDATSWWESLPRPAAAAVQDGTAGEAAERGASAGSAGSGSGSVGSAGRDRREPRPAPWRRVWAATEPAGRTGSRSPWS